MSLTFRSPPRISAATFAAVLAQFRSPCAPIAQQCYDIIVQNSLDPAVALAFFGKESTFGTRGIAGETRNWGNVRTAFKPERATGQHPQGFAIFPDWQIGLQDWCERINTRYIDERGLATVEQAIPVYAPASDGNDPQGYIDFVTSHVAQWQAMEAPQGMNTYSCEREFQGGYTTRRRSTRWIVVHHAAALYRQQTGIEDVRAVARYHTVDRGWPGIGYTIALAEEQQGGAIARYNLSDLELERAHILGRNGDAIGVACLTNFVGLPEQKWVDALVPVLKELKIVYPNASIVGHKEITIPGGETACPGPAWHLWKPRLLAAVETSTSPQPAPQPPGTFPVHPALASFYTRSGGLWQPDRAAPGYALTTLLPDPVIPGARIQEFERAALRLKADGTIDALLRSEWR